MFQIDKEEDLSGTKGIEDSSDTKEARVLILNLWLLGFNHLNKLLLLALNQLKASCVCFHKD